MPPSHPSVAFCDHHSDEGKNVGEQKRAFEDYFLFSGSRVQEEKLLSDSKSKTPVRIFFFFFFWLHSFLSLVVEKSLSLTIRGLSTEAGRREARGEREVRLTASVSRWLETRPSP